MKWDLFVLLALTTIISCCKKEEPLETLYLTNEDKEWNIYNRTDSLIFESNNSNSKTYFVASVTNRIVNGPESEDGTIAYKREEIDIVIYKDDTTDIISMFMTRGYTDYDDRFMFICQWEEYGFTFFNLAQSGTESITINGITYTDVILNNGYDSLINIYYHKEKGFLRFDYLNGEIWERVYQL